MRIEALRADGLNGEDDLGVGDEEESPELSFLDPKEWKVRLSSFSSSGLLAAGFATLPFRSPFFDVT